MTPSRTLAALVLASVAALGSTLATAADDPLSPMYHDALQKKYLMSFMTMDKNNDGYLTMEEFLNKGNPLSPNYKQSPYYTKKLAMWKEMDPDGTGKVSMATFMAYMDKNNPLYPGFKR